MRLHMTTILFALFYAALAFSAIPQARRMGMSETLSFHALGFEINLWVALVFIIPAVAMFLAYMTGAMAVWLDRRIYKDLHRDGLIR